MLDNDVPGRLSALERQLRWICECMVMAISALMAYCTYQLLLNDFHWEEWIAFVGAIIVYLATVVHLESRASIS